LRKAVVLDKSGTIVDACRVVLDLSNGNYTFCASTLNYVVKKHVVLVNIRGPFKALMEGDVDRLSVKISCCLLPTIPKIEKELLRRKRVLKGLKDVANKVMEYCDSQLGVCTALFVNEEGEVTHAVGLGGRLYEEVQGVVKSIIDSGSDVFLATGNCKEASIRCADLLGIPKRFVLFDATPEEKCRLVKKLRGFYGSVIMVGNDINDLTAMREADVSIMIKRKDLPEEDLIENLDVDYVVPSLYEVEKIVADIKHI
jgi:soluble P-type ATPase